MADDDLARLHLDKAHLGRRGARKSRVILIILLAAALLVGGWLYRTDALPPAVPVRLVNAATLYPAQTLALLNASGYVVAQRKAALGSKITSRLVSIVVIVIILTVVGNTMAMSVRERLWEYAVFNTLDFGGWPITVMIFGESLVLTLIGGGLGIALTFPAAAMFRQALGLFFPVFEVTTPTVYLALAAAVTVGTLAALFPTRQALRVRIADGLRWLG
mgnify:CR=1 FL=1